MSRISTAHKISAISKIEEMCSYITDDAWIARYIGVPANEVQAIRARIPKSRGRPQGQGPLSPGDKTLSGLIVGASPIGKACANSTALNIAMWNYYARRARELRIPVREAMVVAGGMRA